MLAVSACKKAGSPTAESATPVEPASPAVANIWEGVPTYPGINGKPNSPKELPANTPAEVRTLLDSIDSKNNKDVSLTDVVAVARQLEPMGTKAAAAGFFIANYARYYAFGIRDLDGSGDVGELARIALVLDPDASFLQFSRFDYNPVGYEQDRERIVKFYALAPLPRAKAEPSLRMAFNRDPDPGIRRAAEMGLERSGAMTPAAELPVGERLARNPSNIHQLTAHEFQNLSDDEKRAIVVQLLQDRGPQASTTLTQIIYAANSPIIFETVQKSLDDPALRERALYTLWSEEKLQKQLPVERYVSFLSDDSRQVRQLSKEILFRRVDYRQRFRLYLGLLETGNAPAIQAAAEGLNEITKKNFGADLPVWKEWLNNRVAMTPEILIAGDFHGDEVPLNAPGRWWGVCAEGNGRTLREVTLLVNPVHDSILDSGPVVEGQGSGAQISADSCQSPVFFRNMGKLRAGPIEESALTPDESGRAEGTFGKTAVSVTYEALGSSGYKLIMKYGNRSQIIYQTDTADLENPKGAWGVAFLGDIDRDGKPDLVLNSSNHYNASDIFFFLSSKAQSNEIVHQMATFRAVGC